MANQNPRRQQMDVHIKSSGISQVDIDLEASIIDVNQYQLNIVQLKVILRNKKQTIRIIMPIQKLSR